MAAVKPEVLVSRQLDKIATPFQRLTPMFGVQEINCVITNIAQCNQKSEKFKMAAVKLASRQVATPF